MAKKIHFPPGAPERSIQVPQSLFDLMDVVTARQDTLTFGFKCITCRRIVLVATPLLDGQRPRTEEELAGQFVEEFSTGALSYWRKDDCSNDLACSSCGGSSFGDFASTYLTQHAPDASENITALAEYRNSHGVAVPSPPAPAPPAVGASPIAPAPPPTQPRIKRSTPTQEPFSVAIPGSGEVTKLMTKMFKEVLTHVYDGGTLPGSAKVWVEFKMEDIRELKKLIPTEGQSDESA